MTKPRASPSASPSPSKRKADPLNDSLITSSTTDSRPAKVRAKKTTRVESLFDKYANTSLGMIDPAGIEAFCSDMKVEYTDVRILMLAWKMKAQKQAYFSREEWQTGLKALKVNTLAQLKKALPELEKEVGMANNFEDFYSYAFRYCLTEEQQKTVDIDSICELLNLVLRSRFCSEVASLTEYLKIQSDYKVINLDQWTCFLRFFKEVSFTDLDKYDASDAWPLILDNFVDWMKENRQ
ncbi:uncharacterized protein LOC126666350 isoform X1 [Mercurialis annua]|uniref:uncharacterized protein LOC126666350 isoform X1 n=2 Tax=Mercurialis annua TaxID=3986 RepID=UPI00215FB650|nr:uncharacterized protein LOC126666350 isoform X1 [Mercurialis annua]